MAIDIYKLPRCEQEYKVNIKKALNKNGTYP
jgi:hypothetical protein